MDAFITSAYPFPRSLPSTRHVPRCALDTEAPPQSRYAKNFPASCFEAPYISLLDSGIELVNKVGLVREQVPLDLEHAADFLAQLRAAQAKTDADPSLIFCGPAEDNMASDPVDKYYPNFRRDEAPIIEIVPPSETSEGQVTISLGAVMATPPPEHEEASTVDVKLGSSWNKAPSLSPSQIIDMFFGKQRRNVAPVIEIPDGDLAVSLEMKQILGECEAELYPKESRFLAPDIQIQKPKGEWDTTGFINFSMAEVQLPLVEAALLKKSLLPPSAV